MRPIVKLFLLLVLSTLALDLSSMEQSGILPLGNDRYRVTASERIINITPEEAEKRAINKARESVVGFHSGLEVTSRLVNFDSAIDQVEVRQYFSNITMIMSQGFIVGQNLIEKTMDIAEGFPRVQVVLDLEVGSQKGKRDYGFNISAELNQQTFREGERLIIRVFPSQDCYITVINIYSNETVSLIFPNVARDDNFAVANSPFVIPSSTDVFSYPLYLLPGKEKDTESLLIIATKKRFDISSFNQLSSYKTYESNLTAIMKELAKIPREEIEIDFLEYGVFKK